MREALRSAAECDVEHFEGVAEIDPFLDALASCVVLTGEEQAQLKAAYLAMGGAPFTKHANAASAWVYKLLSPDEAGDE